MTRILRRSERPAGPMPAVLVALLAVAVAVVLGGCGGAGSTASPPAEGSRAEGLVVDITSAGPVDVSAFSIRTADGSVMEFAVGALELSDGGFPAEHLGEHRLAAEPVAVHYRDEGGRHVAYRITDVAEAPAPS